MNTPDFKFTLISNLDKINTLGSVGAEWANFNFGANAPWTNGAGRIQNVNAGASSDILYRNVNFVTGKRYLCFITYTSVNACQIQIRTSVSVAHAVYLLNASAQSSPRVLTCEWIQYADDPKLEIVLLNSIGGLNFSFSQILIQEYDSLQRVVIPGGWKGLTKSLERIPRYFGFTETLEGSIDLFGEDLAWLKGYLIPQPDKRFKCKVEISVGGAALQPFFTGLMDTVSLNSVGVGRPGDISTYRATIPFLKETEWSRFTSYLSESIDVTSNKGVHGLDVVDSRGAVDWLQPPSGLSPRLRMQFEGTMTPSISVQLAADEIVNIGFDNTVVLNDGFDIFKGTSKQDSFVLPQGAFISIDAFVTLYFTPIANVFVEALAPGGVYDNIANGALTNVTIPEGGFNGGSTGWHIRIRNGSGSTKTLVFGATIGTIKFTSQVQFNLQPHGMMPLMFLKANLARILGEYDNLVTPVFEDNSINVTATTVSDTPLQNPPPKFRPYNVPVGGVGNNAIPIGNYFTGAEALWTYAAPNLYSCNSIGAFSNALLIPFIKFDGFANYTTYATKGRYTLSINVVATTGGVFEVYGFIDGAFTFLKNFSAAAVGVVSVDIDVTKYYEALGVTVGNSNLTVNAIVMSPKAGDPQVNRGKYALNYLSNGFESKRNTAISAISTLSQFRPFQDGLDGLLTIFGLGVEPESLSDGRIKLNIDEYSSFFLNASLPPLFAEEFDINLDSEIIRDFVEVGGPSRRDNKVDQDSSCSIANYTSTFITTRSKYNLRSEVSLNSALILNQELSNEALFLLNLSYKDLVGSVTPRPIYRTSNDLTITGSPSPRQPNWVHSEGRIVRRNISIIGSMMSRIISLVGGVASTQVAVDAGDGLGAISDASPIFAAGLFTPYLIAFETAMTNDEYNFYFTNRKSTRKVSIEGIERSYHTKSIRYNAASGRATIAGWLVSAGDFSDDFSDDFDNEAISTDI